jgi:ppGpp synthetase/RelA/SpoT-type nucleotidyltranferase
MSNELTKGAIDRLGDKIREESVAISDITLSELQNYRISHKETLSQVFNTLCKLSRKIHASSIVTFRIKRFESIIGKLERYQDMRFSRMWDIAGCRCIVRNNNDVYKFKKLIEEDIELEIVKEYDYIKIPQENGYKSLHLFIKIRSSQTIIELQIRNVKDHNWATLVEITDLLYDSRLKEYGENKELLRFHYLLSKVEDLQINEKYEISKIINEYKYFEKLSETFSKNYLKVRKKWFELESQSDHKYFLIETTKTDVPNIESFSNFQDAEDRYFNVYKTRQNANIVLTHLPNANYNQISIAYSNYILTFHTFISESFDIMESLIIESLQNRKYIAFFKNYKLYQELLFNHIKNMLTEIVEIQEFSSNKKSKKNNHKKKEKEWILDIRKHAENNQNRSKNLQKEFNRNMPQTIFGKFMINQITKRIGNGYRKKIEKVLATT